MGRPPIGKVAMTSTERVHRFRAKHRTGKPETKRNETEIARLKARIRELEAALAHGEGQVTRSTRGGTRMEFTEVGRLRAEIGRLKSDIIKLKRMLQEEPDAAKLRKKVIDQQVEMASMRQVMKKIAKERDKYVRRRQPKYREAEKLLTRQSYNVTIKALHPDRTPHVTPAEKAAAERVVTGLRPLFDEG